MDTTNTHFAGFVEDVIARSERLRGTTKACSVSELAYLVIQEITGVAPAKKQREHSPTARQSGAPKTGLKTQPKSPLPEHIFSGGGEKLPMPARVAPRQAKDDDQVVDAVNGCLSMDKKKPVRRESGNAGEDNRSNASDSKHRMTIEEAVACVLEGNLTRRCMWLTTRGANAGTVCGDPGLPNTSGKDARCKKCAANKLNALLKHLPASLTSGPVVAAETAARSIPAKQAIAPAQESGLIKDQDGNPDLPVSETQSVRSSSRAHSEAKSIASDAIQAKKDSSSSPARSQSALQESASPMAIETDPAALDPDTLTLITNFADAADVYVTKLTHSTENRVVVMKVDEGVYNIVGKYKTNDYQSVLKNTGNLYEFLDNLLPIDGDEPEFAFLVRRGFKTYLYKNDSTKKLVRYK